MLKLKHSIAACAGAALLFLLAGSSAAQEQEQKKADKSPPQDVRVINAVPSYPGVPPGAFSVRTVNFPGVINPDPEGTGYAISSWTMSNNGAAPVQAQMFGFWGEQEALGTSCENFPVGTQFSVGPVVTVPPGQTVHLTFPQPFVLPARPGAVSCLHVVANGNWSTNVVGYRLPPAVQPQP